MAKKMQDQDGKAVKGIVSVVLGDMLFENIKKIDRQDNKGIYIG